ncbi:MAG: hypothetical protein HC904_02330 [Blastochloris sp.]|nr:hypothetical protein [Blastochloris sp.]
MNLSQAEEIIYPDKAGITNLKRDFGAKGDGVTDDTAAIQKALNEKKGILYLPAGTYMISDTLRWGKGEKRTILQGNSGTRRSSS